MVATGGTAAVLEKAGLEGAAHFQNLPKGRPNAVDLLKNKEIQLVINTPAGQSPRADEVKIRTTAVYTGTPIMTTMSGAKAAAARHRRAQAKAGTRSRRCRSITEMTGPPLDRVCLFAGAWRKDFYGIKCANIASSLNKVGMKCKPSIEFSATEKQFLEALR